MNTLQSRACRALCSRHCAVAPAGWLRGGGGADAHRPITGRGAAPGRRRAGWRRSPANCSAMCRASCVSAWCSAGWRPTWCSRTAMTADVQLDGVTGAAHAHRGRARSGTTVQEAWRRRRRPHQERRHVDLHLGAPHGCGAGTAAGAPAPRRRRRRRHGRRGIARRRRQPLLPPGHVPGAAAQRVAVLGASQTYYTLDLCADGMACAVSQSAAVPARGHQEHGRAGRAERVEPGRRSPERQRAHRRAHRRQPAASATRWCWSRSTHRSWPWRPCPPTCPTANARR